MFNALVKVQWIRTRAVVLLAVVIGFGIPIASVQDLRVYGTFGQPITLVRDMQSYGVLYAMLAAGAGLLVALMAWNPDHRGRHVYMLSLPIARFRYAGYRFLAGALFLVLPAIAVAIGAFVAISVVRVPEGLHAYQISLALRFLLSSLVAYALFFAIAASSQRASAAVLITIGLVLLLTIGLGAAGVDYNFLSKVGPLLFSEPGVLSVFTGRWMLIDV